MKYLVFIVGLITMIQGGFLNGCRRSDIDSAIFDVAYWAKSNEITKEKFFGEYYYIFPLGEFVLEFKPFDDSFKSVEKYDGVYQQRIHWKSGRVYKSEWQLFNLGLAYKEPYVGLSGLKWRLFRQEIDFGPSWKLLEKEPSDVEISACPITHLHADLGFNYYHEIVIWLGPDPDIWYAKRSKKYPIPTTDK